VKVVYHTLDQQDLDNAWRYYENASEDLGDQFLGEFLAVIASIQRNEIKRRPCRVLGVHAHAAKNRDIHHAKSQSREKMPRKDARHFSSDKPLRFDFKWTANVPGPVAWRSVTRRIVPLSLVLKLNWSRQPAAGAVRPPAHAAQCRPRLAGFSAMLCFDSPIEGQTLGSCSAAATRPSQQTKE